MTLAALRQTPGRRPFVFVEIDLETCLLTYGTGACTAVLGTTGTKKCFNTFGGCQARAAFAIGGNNGIKTYRFSSLDQECRDVSFDAIPCLDTISFASTKIDQLDGIGTRASATLTMRDVPHNDVGLDPYLTSRSYNPLTSSTYWARFVARNPYVQGRPLRVYIGYLTSAGLVDMANFAVQHFIIDAITPPAASGAVTISAKDPLHLANDDKTQLPAASPAKLLADITSGSATLTLDTTGDGDAYFLLSGYLLIDSEVIQYTRTSGSDVLTLAARGVRGTVADAHSATAKIQGCYQIGPARAEVVLQRLLNDCGIDDSFLDLAGWATEAGEWLTEANLDGLVQEATGANDLIKRVCGEAGMFVWWSTRENVVRMRAIRPAISDEITTLNDSDNLLQGQASVKVDDTRRLTEVVVEFELKDPTFDDKPASYAQAQVTVAPGAADPAGFEYRSAASLTINARDLGHDSLSQAENIADRLLSAYLLPPTIVTIKLDAKDADLWTGDVVALDFRIFVDDEGQRAPLLCLVVEAVESNNGHQITLTCESTVTPGRFAVFEDDPWPDYDSATAAERDPGGYLADASGLNGSDEPYLMS